MLGVINLIVGVAMAAGSAVLNPIETASSFINLCKELLNANSEYIGDSTQGFIPYIVKKIQNWKASKAIDAAIKGQDDVDICEQVFNEINEKLKNKKSKLGEIFHRNPKKQQIKNDARAVAELSFKSLFNVDYNSFLNDNSQTYQGLDPNQKAQIIEIIKIAVQAFYEYKFSKIDPDLQIACGVISMSIKSYIDDKEEKFSQKLISCITDHNNGSISLQAVANAKFAPKYILRSCPGCGYDGDRLLVNEKTGTVKCAACGKSYDLVQYAEPEIYAEIVKKVEAGLENDKAIKKIANESAADVKEIKKQLTVYYSQSLTKNYLEACLKGQADQFHNDLVTLREDNNKFQDDFKKRFTEIEADFSSLRKGQQGLQQGQQDLKKGQAQLLENSKDILDFLKKKTEEDRQVVGHFSQKLDSLDKQVNSLYEYAKEMFPELSGKSDLILEYVQKLCSKEYYEEMSNALGTDINKAISMEMKNGYEHIQALNSTSVSQIISAIEDLKKDCAKEGVVLDRKIIEDSIRNANIQLSGQITGLQSLVERNQELISAKIKEGNEKTLSLLRIIIKGQEEQTAIMLANAGLKMDRHDFARIYQGKIPSKYLYDEGFGGSFPCPYCGVEETRKLNDDQYCRCSVCKNRFLAVNPFLPQEQSNGRSIEEILKQDYGRDDVVTIDKIKDWREANTAKITNGGALYKWKINEGIVIVPEKYGVRIDNFTFSSTNYLHKIETLIFNSSVQYLGWKALNKYNLTNLKRIIFLSNEKGESSLIEFTDDNANQFRKFCNRHRGIDIFGHFNDGQKIVDLCD